ncbi:hypothetical protein M3Y96_00617500 [Aphelenchoides besseyi]|nr:hypothetical protein M3Y96_00617500 [Aphelenchoides besseyi]
MESVQIDPENDVEIKKPRITRVLSTRGSTCLCDINVNVAVYYVGFSFLALDIIDLCHSGSYLIITDLFEWELFFELLMGVISVFATINMIHGAYYRKPKLLRPFIYWEVITVGLCIFFAFCMIFTIVSVSASTREEIRELHDYPHNVLESYFWLVSFLFYAGLNYYFGYVVVSRFYNQLLDEECVQLDNLHETNRIGEFIEQTHLKISPTSIVHLYFTTFELTFIISVQLYLPRSSVKMLQLPKTTGKECLWGIPVHTGAFAIGVSVALLGINDLFVLAYEFVLVPTSAFLVFEFLMCCINVASAGLVLRGLHLRQAVLFEPFLVYEIVLCIVCTFLGAIMLILCFLIVIKDDPYLQVVDIPHTLKEALLLFIILMLLGMFSYYSYVVVKRSQNLLIEELNSSVQGEQLEEQTETDDLAKLV